MPQWSPLEFDHEFFASEICSFISKSVGKRGAVLGLSGGIDSAVTAKLTARALGQGRVLALIMPDSIATPYDDVSDARSLAEEIGIDYRVIDITEAAEGLVGLALRAGGCRDRVAEGNVRARLRMTILYYFANSENRVVVGSGDRSELMIGYFTKYGDGGVDLLPLGCLYKTQVRDLARWIGIPQRIVRKESSPRLWQHQTAEGELGLSYEEIDTILYKLIDLRKGEEEVIRDLGDSYADKVAKVSSMVRRSAHKRRTPPVPRIKR